MKKPYVAIVDDDSGFAGYLRTFLSLRGYETRSYSRGDEMVASIKQNDPPDVVLLDVMMPGMNGLETLRTLKTAKPDLPIIMLSGRDQAATIVEAVRLGATDYVVKPGDPEGLGEIQLDSAIKSALEKSRLVNEITELRRQISDDQDRAFLLWGDSPQMKTIAQVVEQVADSDVTVLIRGESGVGKELVARAIHERSSRKARPFVKVNCAALPAELLESELFGHEKGAFTGAATTRIGKFEQADTGTIFLDEIGEMKAALQAKLLHVLQDAQFTKLGSNKSINIDVRVVAATNRDLEMMMLRNEFREDLYYRLKVIEVTVPPLRERRPEVPKLTALFIDRYTRRYNRPAPELSAELQQLLQAYDWPGNIRELENLVKRLVILQDEELVIREMQRSPRAVAAYAMAGAPVPAGPIPAGPIPVGSVRPPTVSDSDDDEDVEDEEAQPEVAVATAPAGSRLADVAKAAAINAERTIIEETLRQHQWNRRKAAEQLGVSYKTLLNKIKECGIAKK